MIGISVDTSDPGDVATAIDDGTQEAIERAARIGFEESQKQVPVASGDLKQSGEFIVTEHAATFQYDSDYAEYVEGGTPPHWPPIEPLKEWAEIVLGDESAAYAVQQHIAEEGTEPQRFLNAGFQAMGSELQRRGIVVDVEGQL